MVAIADRDRVGQRADDRIEAALASAQRRLELLHQAFTIAFAVHPLADVLDERVKEPAGSVAVRGDRDLDGELAAVRAHSRDLDPLVEDGPRAVDEESLESLQVCPAQTLGDDQVRHPATDGLLTRDAEDALRAWIPVRHDALLVHQDGGVVSTVEDELREILGHRADYLPRRRAA